MTIADLEVVGTHRFGEGGFLCVLRCDVRNVDASGGRSAPHTVDVVERRCGADAVVVLPYERSPLRVLLRRGLRPALRLGRGGEALRDGSPAPLMLVEAVAGVIEHEDEGVEGLLRRAVIELREEAGLVVPAGDLEPLGPPAFMSPGAMAEQVHFLAVETALDRRHPIEGDGSLMEAGGEVVTLPLAEALRRCEAGEIADLKSECALRRLADRVGA